MNVVPAIDLRGGRVVRLRQGDYEREQRYERAPGDLAAHYADTGARLLHVVDLDGARGGGFENLAAIASIVRCGARVQCGGGVREEDHVARLLDLGVARVVIGSVAVREPSLVQKWIADFGAERVVVALDTRFDGHAWRLPVAGWRCESEATLEALVERYADTGTRHLLCTDIARDGMMTGPNVDLYAMLRSLAPHMDVQASGGIRDANDVRALREIGVASAIVGRSLLDGAFALDAALAC